MEKGKLLQSKADKAGLVMKVLERIVDHLRQWTIPSLALSQAKARQPKSL